jgi:hypothetical protein
MEHITFTTIYVSRDIYKCRRGTDRVSRVYNATDVLWLQCMMHVNVTSNDKHFLLLH